MPPVGIQKWGAITYGKLEIGCAKKLVQQLIIFSSPSDKVQCSVMIHTLIHTRMTVLVIII